jgi:hypothetical protein
MLSPSERQSKYTNFATVTRRTTLARAAIDKKTLHLAALVPRPQCPGQ